MSWAVLRCCHTTMLVTAVYVRGNLDLTRPSCLDPPTKLKVVACCTLHQEQRQALNCCRIHYTAAGEHTAAHAFPSTLHWRHPHRLWSTATRLRSHILDQPTSAFHPPYCYKKHSTSLANHMAQYTYPNLPSLSSVTLLGRGVRQVRVHPVHLLPDIIGQRPPGRGGHQLPQLWHAGGAHDRAGNQRVTHNEPACTAVGGGGTSTEGVLGVSAVGACPRGLAPKQRRRSPVPGCHGRWWLDWVVVVNGVCPSVSVGPGPTLVRALWASCPPAPRPRSTAVPPPPRRDGSRTATRPRRTAPGIG